MRCLRLLSALAVVLAACFRQAEPEIHLIPAGYSGGVYILHDVVGGVPVRYEDGARVYDIPSDGILRPASPMPEGRWGPGDVRYFYVSEDGSRSPIVVDWPSSIHDTPANRADPMVGIYFRSFGSSGIKSTMSCPVVHEHYSVGTRAYLLDHPEKPGERLFEHLKQHPVQCSRPHRRRRATARRP